MLPFKFTTIKTQTAKVIVNAMFPLTFAPPGKNGIKPKKLLNNINVDVTRIAHGIPLGVDMEYIDSLTLELAFQDRIKLS